MKAITIMLSVFLFTSITYNQNVKFEDWDIDGDGKLERVEFTRSFKDVYFNKFDPKTENGVLERGFFENSYAGLDTDNDRYLTDEEWLIGYNYFYNGYILTGEIVFLDANDDGKISFDEYYDALGDTDYYADIDVDKDTYISEHELANYVFDNWDRNDSGVISRSEFKEFDRYYLDV